MSERVYQPESKASNYVLGDWLLCVRTNVLSRGEVRVELENRLVLLLIFFIENRGEVLGKERILKTIWQGKVVNDDSLAVAISHLRKALGDNSRSPDYIKTIPGVGYQLIANAGVVTPPNQNQATGIGDNSIIVKTRPARWFAIPIAICLLIVVAAAYYAVNGSATLPASHTAPINKRAPSLSPEQQRDWDHAQRKLNGHTPEAWKTTIQVARALLQQHSDFAPAYAAIAEAKIKLLHEKLAMRDNCGEVLGLLNKSLELDPQQQKVLVTRGNALFWCVRNQVAAAQDYQRAIALDPRDDIAPMQYAQLLLAQGKFAESLQQVEVSRQLNPLNYSVPTVVWIYQMQARDELAFNELERINSAEPGDRYFHISAQRVYARLGRDKDSMEHWLWLMRDAKYTEADIAAAQSAFAAGGLEAVNRWLLARKDSVDLGQYVPPLSWARYAIAAGKLELALDYLEQAFVERQSPLLWGNVDPAYDPVRGHPRFQAIMQKLQQPEFSVP
jgi:DNA-binding winged helix-turn-helix (wHTH) protein